MISIISDLHLDFKKDRHVEKIVEGLCKKEGGDLIIAGDVSSVHTVKGFGRWKYLIDNVSKKYDNIICVMGNHEHYFGDVMQTAGILRNNFPQIQLLDRDVWHNNQYDYSIAGCTLWSKINDPNLAEIEVNTLLNCYYEDNFFTAEKYNEAHEIDLQWLKNQNNKIVVTHYPPTSKACKNIGGDQYFCSNQDQILKGRKLWICGHTHMRKDFYHLGCRVILNCVGHKQEYNSFLLKTIYLSSES